MIHKLAMLFYFLLFIEPAYTTPGKLDIITEIKLSLGYPLDSLLNFTELTAQYGYPVEEHVVITEDGYIITIFRIVRGKKCRGPLKQPPVLLMHGMLMTSDLWLDSGPDAGLAYLIADACYDLWVGNVRGNYYGKRHEKLNPDENDAFWNFTVNEMGHFDLPAIIDHILAYATVKKINYVGYSQGGSIYVIMCSERQKYCDKVQVAILLAPGSRLANVDSIILRSIISLYYFFSPFLTAIGINEVLPRGGIVQQIGAFLCKDYVIADIFCRGFFSLLDAPHPGSIATSTLRVLAGHLPSGTSVKNIIWYHQALNVETFQKYDYGVIGNKKIYNSAKPPTYNIKATTTPTVIIRGKNDHFAVSSDLDWLVSQLPNVKEDFTVEDALWNHFDVPYSMLTGHEILPKITDCLNKFGKTEKVRGTKVSHVILPWLFPAHINPKP